MDLGTIQYNVAANTSSVEASIPIIDSMAEHAEQAGVSVGTMGTKVTSASKQSAVALDAAGKQMSRTRGMAQNLGFQDMAVQAQAGTSAFVIFTQQGSQLVSGFNPILGAVLAVGGALAGVLFSSLMATGKAMEEMADRAKELTKDMDELTEAQKRVVAAATGYSIRDKQKEYDDLSESIRSQTQSIADLRAENGKLIKVQSTYGQALTVSINNTLQIDKASEALVATQLAQVEVERELAELKGEGTKKDKERLSAAQQQIKALRDEQAELGLTGVAMANYLADKAKATAAERVLIQMLYLSNEARRIVDAQTKKAEQERKQAAERAKTDEKNRLESIKKLNDQMAREAALMGVTSEAAKVEYDIKNGLIKVTNGLAGAEAQRLIQSAKATDAARAQKAAQDEYIEKLSEWVKGERDKEAQVKAIITALEAENAELSNTADAYLEIQMRALNATDAEIARAKTLAKTNRQLKETASQTEKMFDRLDEVGAGIWTDFLEGTKTTTESVKRMFTSMLADIAHQAVTKPIILNIQQSMSGGTGAGKASSIGQSAQGGIYAMIAVAAVSAISSYNRDQDRKFEKLTAVYRQGTQSTGTILGQANAKSDSIAKATADLANVASKTLDVNYNMYRALTAIESGINGVAAGFARQFSLSSKTGDFSGINTGTSTFNYGLGSLGEGKQFEYMYYTADQVFGKYLGGVFDIVDGFLTGFGKKASEAVYSKKKKITDTGIGFVGQTLADILESGTVGAFAYADVQTKKKVLGVTTSNSIKTIKKDMDAVLLGQFADVFSGAGEALGAAATAFGLNFDDYLAKLVVDPQKLSLKDLEGEELTKEIESFFSSTLDNWAGVLTTGSGILEEFQQVGEGAFETVIRLASELNTFNRYAEALDLNFGLVGLSAIAAQQNIAKLSGGMDQLNTSLSGYYANFFTASERAEHTTALLTKELNALGIDAVPASRDAFRQLIEGIDLSTGAGQKQFAGLINLQGVFAELVPAVDSATKSLEELQRTAAETALAGLDRAVAAQRKILDSQRSVLESSLSSSRAVFSALETSLSGMVATSVRTQEAVRRQAQTELEGMLSSARGGQLPAADALSRVLQAVQPATGMYATFEDYATDLYRTAGTIKELKDITGEQISNEERALSELEKQSALLDEVSEWGRMQVDILNGVDVSVSTVAAALSALSSVLGVAYPSTEQQLQLAEMARNAETSRAEVKQAYDAIATNAAAQQQRSKEYEEYMKASQFAIAENSAQIRKLIEKFDGIGIPLRDETITALAEAIA